MAWHQLTAPPAQGPRVKSIPLFTDALFFSAEEKREVVWGGGGKKAEGLGS